jgi:hypothetical protein
VAHRPLPFPPAPVSMPPYPFTEWPYGGASTIGATTPNSVDSPLMTALAPTDTGKWMKDNNIQLYGWVNAGFNISSAQGNKQGNYPANYMYKPNTGELDQAVVYFERLPNTVQQDHIDWGFRLSGIYGENYRYTTAYGLASYQLQKNNYENGYDFPMMYGEVYIPKVADGLVIRFGRYISVPDIEAQLAPNNYMYSHSMTYGFDNYTNTGVIASLQANKNWVLQAGISDGTDSMPWMASKDPGVQPTLTACARWSSDNSKNNINFCANGINDGTYGYNNLQWYGLTAYHKFDEKWHLSFELYHMHENNVPNVNYVGADPLPTNNLFDPLKNGPFKAICKDAAQSGCTAQAYAGLAYLNYKYSSLDNFTLRYEHFNDINGQRTGVNTFYDNLALGWQHWLSPSITLRPEVAWYHSDKAAFGRDASGVPSQHDVAIFSTDLIVHF